MSRPRLVSLFAGYGGLDLALAEAFDAETVAYADVCKVSDDGTVGHYEPHRSPCCILAHRFPDVPNLGDVSEVDWYGFVRDLPPDVVRHLIVAGGFPCQDVSHAGRRAGLIRDGEGRTRSGLWGQMLRAIDELRPALVVAENVRGLLSATADSDVEPCSWCLGDADGEPHMRALGAVLADLADIGYDANWYGLRAADVGAAHGRFRVFIFAWPRDGADTLRSRLDGRSPDAQWGTVRRAPVAGSGEVPSGLSLPTPQARDWKGEPSAARSRERATERSINLGEVLQLLPTPAVNDMGAGKTPDAWDAWTEAMQAKHGNGNGHGRSLEIEAQRLMPTPRAGDGVKGGPNQAGSSGDLMLPSAVQDWREYEAAIRRQENAFGRPAPLPTETGPKGSPRLSARFSEWLMGLPDGWITDPAIWIDMKPSAARNAQLKASGNGVCPQQAYAACEAFRHDFLTEVAS